MTSVIVVLPKAEDAKGIKGLLGRSGIPVAGVCTTGSKAIAWADNLGGGIVVCGYKLPDMVCSQLREDLPQGFEMLVLASHHVIESGLIDREIPHLAMPLKAQELVETVDGMIEAMERARRRRREMPRQRKPGDQALIWQAKEILMNRNHMTEEEAHKYIQKCSMDSGTNMVETAQMVLAMMKTE